MIPALSAVIGFVFGWFLGVIVGAATPPSTSENQKEDFNFSPFDPHPVRDDSFFVLTTGDHHDQK